MPESRDASCDFAPVSNKGSQPSQEPNPSGVSSLLSHRGSYGPCIASVGHHNLF